jgi:hypothetical protein
MYVDEAFKIWNCHCQCVDGGNMTETPTESLYLLSLQSLRMVIFISELNVWAGKVMIVEKLLYGLQLSVIPSYQHLKFHNIVLHIVCQAVACDIVCIAHVETKNNPAKHYWIASPIFFTFRVTLVYGRLSEV